MKTKYQSLLLGSRHPNDPRIDVALSGEGDDSVAIIYFRSEQTENEPTPAFAFYAKEWDEFVEDIRAISLEEWDGNLWPFADQERIYGATGLSSGTSISPQEDGSVLLFQKDSRKMKVLHASVWKALVVWIRTTPPSFIMFSRAEAA